MQSKSAHSTVKEMKGIFARHAYGIPNTVIVDNMPFHSKEFYQFSKECKHTLITSNHRYPQSNGMAKRNIQTIKTLFKKS